MPDPVIDTDANTLWKGRFCSTKDRVPPAAAPGFGTKGVGDKERLWKGGGKLLTLRVGFLSGSDTLGQRVVHAANGWGAGGRGGGNLRFEQVSDASKADIRIAFDPAGGSWSLIGTDARLTEPTDATMNLGWATEQLADTEFNSVVLHEFGHALGMLHEHNHPQIDLKWKKDVVYADLGAPPNNWSKADVDYNVFERYPLSRVVITPYDPVSIMIYTIPERWLDGQPAIAPSADLSDGDCDFIQTYYP